MATATPTEEFHISDEEESFLRVLECLGVEANTCDDIRRQFLLSEGADAPDRCAERLSPIIARAWKRVKARGLEPGRISATKWTRWRTKLQEEHKKLTAKEGPPPDDDSNSSYDLEEEEEAVSAASEAESSKSGSDTDAHSESAPATDGPGSAAPGPSRKVAFHERHLPSTLRRMALAVGVDWDDTMSSSPNEHSALAAETVNKICKRTEGRVRAFQALGPSAARRFLGDDVVDFTKANKDSPLPQELLDVLPPRPEDTDRDFDAYLDGAPGIVGYAKRSIAQDAKVLVPAYDAEKDGDFGLLDKADKERVKALNSKAALARQALLHSVTMCLQLTKSTTFYSGGKPANTPGSQQRTGPFVMIEPIRDLLVAHSFTYLEVLAEIRSVYLASKNVDPRDARTGVHQDGIHALFSRAAKEKHRAQAEHRFLVDGISAASQLKRGRDQRAGRTPQQRSSRKGANTSPRTYRKQGSSRRRSRSRERLPSGRSDRSQRSGSTSHVDTQSGQDSDKGFRSRKHHQDRE
jgi:hypothetical protein